MKVSGIKYVASFKDYSGYGSAARKNIAAIRAEGIPICGTNVSFAANESLIDPVELGQVNQILSAQTPYNVLIEHLTPENYQRQEGVLNVGHTVWEASAIHPAWISQLNKMDLILVPCTWNVEVLKESGVKTPTIVYPHSFNTSMFDDVQPHPITNRPDKLKFYSIFQWSERKNPTGLLRAFCSTFSQHDDVVLYLKTYAGSGGESDLRWLKGEIEKVLDSVNKPRQLLPEIVLLTNLTTDSKIRQLHVGCDVYLAPIRGEGFGIPIFEAALAGNFVIATNYGGHTDFLPREHYDLVPYQLTPVTGMSHIKWYTADMYWADPNLNYFCISMQLAYRRWKEKGSVSGAGRLAYSRELKENYSYKSVTRKLLENLDSYL